MKVFSLVRVSLTADCLGRAEATGFGIVWYAEEMLKANGEDMKDKVVAISRIR